MDALYNQTNKLIQETQQCFQNLERNQGNAIDTEIYIQEKIDVINSNCEKLDLLTFKVPINQRQNAKMRCDQLKYDSRHLQAALAAAKQKRNRREAAVSEREQLLNRRFAPNPDVTAINIDYAVSHHNSLQNANRGVDEMLHTGANALESLKSQHITLKGARKRILDMASTLGLSNYTMRLIERRVSQDKFILFGGMFATISVIILVIIYLA